MGAGGGASRQGGTMRTRSMAGYLQMVFAKPACDDDDYRSSTTSKDDDGHERLQVAQRKLALAALGNARLSHYALLQQVDVAGHVAAQMRFHRVRVELSNGRCYEWEQTDEDATLYFPFPAGDYSNYVPDGFTVNYGPDDRHILIGPEDVADRSDDCADEPVEAVAKKQKVEPVVPWLRQEMAEGWGECGPSGSFTGPPGVNFCSGSVVICLYKTEEGQSLTHILKGEMSAAEVERFEAAKQMKQAVNRQSAEILQRFCDVSGPTLHVNVTSIQSTNKARYCDIVVKTLGGSKFKVDVREGGACEWLDAPSSCTFSTSSHICN